MMGLSGASEEAIAVKLSRGHISVLLIGWCRCSPILNISIENLGMPTELASGEEENIVRRGIEWVSIIDALKTLPMVVIQDDILRTSDLITITWQNNCQSP